MESGIRRGGLPQLFLVSGIALDRLLAGGTVGIAGFVFLPPVQSKSKITCRRYDCRHFIHHPVQGVRPLPLAARCSVDDVCSVGYVLFLPMA